MSAPAQSKHSRYWSERESEGEVEESDKREYSKDYDRILYSTAFRRLDGVTQVVSSGEIALFHNRLTHSLKTAQVGARIAYHLRERHSDPASRGIIAEYGGLDPRVVRAACMAHDLGHPPFGHIAEDELQRLCGSDPNENTVFWKGASKNISSRRYPGVPIGFQLEDGFEGNAQSFRIVTRLAFREPGIEAASQRPALNLTRGTLAALLKYPWNHGAGPEPKKKWGYYNSEISVAEWVLGQSPAPMREVSLRDREREGRSIEAQVMDWADDISYAVHDVEDFFRAGVIPLDLLSVESGEWERFFKYAWGRKVGHLFGPGEEDVVAEALREVRRAYFPKGPFTGAGADREALHHFASNIIRAATAAASLDNKGALVVEDKQLAIIETLKQLTWYYVIDRPSLESTQRGQRYIIRSLYRNLIQWVVESWHGPEGIVGDPAARRDGPFGKLPARLVDYLEVAFGFDRNTKQQAYMGDERKLVARAVVDFIVSLTEVQAIELAAKLTGQSPRSMLDSWVYL